MYSSLTKEAISIGTGKGGASHSSKRRTCLKFAIAAVLMPPKGTSNGNHGRDGDAGSNGAGMPTDPKIPRRLRMQALHVGSVASLLSRTRAATCAMFHQRRANINIV